MKSKECRPQPNGVNEYGWLGHAHLSTPQVDELGPKVIRTGVLGPDGKEILRVEHKPEIGFIRFGTSNNRSA